jgi:anthranilate phosphoribosyltransferase
VLKKFIGKVVGGASLTRAEAAAAMRIIMDGAADDAQIAALAVGLRMKGETAGEIAGFAAVMRRRAEKVPSPTRGVVDTCGTGGDSLSTVNVSTLAAIVAAGAGLKVAKHGNRSASGRCGSADVLERLGVSLAVSPAMAAEGLRRNGITFLFAPAFHPALRHAAAARRSIGVRTVFNMLGPLCNPAGATRQVIGVFDGSRLRIMAEAARDLGVKRALVVHGLDGMDELTVTGPTRCVDLSDGRIRWRQILPEEAGLRRHPLRALVGGGPEVNARRAMDVLGGRRGAARDLVLLNAGAALLVGGAARTLREGVSAAAESLDTGRAAAKLEALREFSRLEKVGP